MSVTDHKPELILSKRQPISHPYLTKTLFITRSDSKLYQQKILFLIWYLQVEPATQHKLAVCSCFDIKTLFSCMGIPQLWDSLTIILRTPLLVNGIFIVKQLPGFLGILVSIHVEVRSLVLPFAQDPFDIDGILSKGPYPPCLRMADRALLAGYLGIRNVSWQWLFNS